MLKLDKRALRRVLQVHRKCAEIDAKHPEAGLVEKFEQALDYLADFGDADEKGNSTGRCDIIASPEYTDSEDGELHTNHFHFWCSIRPAGKTGDSGGFLMCFHSPGPLGGPFELVTKEGPHWTFHS